MPTDQAEAKEVKEYFKLNSWRYAFTHTAWMNIAHSHTVLYIQRDSVDYKSFDFGAGIRGDWNSVLFGVCRRW